MKYVVTVNGEKFEVEVEQVSGQKSTAASQPVAAPSAPAAPAVKPVAAAGKTTVNAPMPGTILAVKVEKGQQVKKGQILFVLEAMKMENEIVAAEDGVVADIAVAKGASVSTGDVLAVIE